MNKDFIQVTAKDYNSEWNVGVEIRERTETLILGEITARGSSFTFALIRVSLFGPIISWAILLPDLEVGCSISSDYLWNEEKLKSKVENKIDRMSIIAAVNHLLND